MIAQLRANHSFLGKRISAQPYFAVFAALVARNFLNPLRTRFLRARGVTLALFAPRAASGISGLAMGIQANEQRREIGVMVGGVFGLGLCALPLQLSTH
jgi:hypothetical protein